MLAFSIIFFIIGIALLLKFSYQNTISRIGISLFALIAILGVVYANTGKRFKN
ncbi:hypothetical protein [Clostridium arbusti]|uniref:hypothetical protein n=1 Tax=Clostridium arbusti TaxID=1137848 RepID=UPI0002F40EC8